MPTARLADRAVLKVTGEDARAFLQNLVTEDVARIDAAGAGYAALLTPQGKIIADFLVFPAPDGYRLDVAAGAAEALGKRLALYRLRSRVTVAPDADAVFARWDEEGAGPPDPRFAGLGARFLAPAGEVAADATPEEYHRHRIALGVPEGGIDFLYNDAFPHEAGMDALNGVSFAKGCYVGQEVVSRMQHRGTARTRPVTVRAEGSAALPGPGAEITAGGRSVGRLGSSAGGRGVALARLDRAREAMAEGVPVLADETAVTLALPPWATYSWPEAQPRAGGA